MNYAKKYIEYNNDKSLKGVVEKRGRKGENLKERGNNE